MPVRQYFLSSREIVLGRHRKYSNHEEILVRMRQPGAPSIGVLSEEAGVPKATLYAWLRLAGGRPVGTVNEVLKMAKKPTGKNVPQAKS